MKDYSTIITTPQPTSDDTIEALAELSSECQEGTYKPSHKITYKHGFKDGYKSAMRTEHIQHTVECAHYKSINNNIFFCEICNKNIQPTEEDGNPLLIMPNDTRILVNGKPLTVPFRIVSEENYQKYKKALQHSHPTEQKVQTAEKLEEEILKNCIDYEQEFSARQTNQIFLAMKIYAKQILSQSK